MSASPTPNPALAAPPLSTSTTPPPQSSFPPPSPLSSPPPDPPPPQANSSPPQPPIAPVPQLNFPPATASPPQQSSPPMASQPPSNSPPPSTPPPANAPPPSTPPANTPPSQPSSPPPPPPSSLPPSPPSSPPSSSPPPLTNSPPPATPPNNPPRPPTTPITPPGRSPPPPRPPNNPPSTPPNRPESAPPAPSTEPPQNSPPPPPPNRTERPPPPPSNERPQNSPPPPHNRTESPPSPPSSEPPQNSPPPSPVVAPPRPASPPVPFRSPPPADSPPRSPPPPNSIRMSPPPPSTVPSPPVSPPSPFLDPQGNTSTNNPSGNAPQSSGSPGNGGIGTGATVAIAVALSLLLLAIFGIAACCIWKRKKKASGHSVGHVLPTSIGSPASDSGLLKLQIATPDNGSGFGNGIIYSPHEPGGLGNSRSWFKYEDLVDATHGFSAQNLLGEGGFGSVYKGILADGREVAIKQLKSGGGQGEREFRAEVEIISRIHHRHLVSLVGYCISGVRRLLVYDFLPNNTLYFHLHGEGQPVMDWARRIKIAIGAARGIAYLHEDCHPRIIHRDIKSSNILLDSNFEARVSDFGLAKLAMDANTHITTRVMGTFGYMAPEYASSGKLTEKSDVYSFGVVLLELITGRKPVDTSQPLGEESLVEWARPLLGHAIETEEFGELADPRLNGNFVGVEMFRLIEAAAACVRHSSAKRPTMGQVVRAFDSMATSDLMNGMRVGESEIFNSAQQSEEIRLFRRMAFGSREYSTDFFTQNSHSSEGNRENN